MRLARRLVLALWAGSLATVGLLVAPALFRVLPERALAGLAAGELFRLLTWVSVAAAVALVLLPAGRPAPPPAGPSPRRAALARFAPVVPAALLLASELGLRPAMDAARAAGQVTPAFMALHGVSAALYGVASLVALALLVRELRD